MDASKAFKNILQQIESSNLNFKLEISPFSAVISLKKSFIRDKSGNLLSSNPSETPALHRLDEENQILSTKISQNESDFQSLKYEYEKAVYDCEEAYKVIHNLEFRNEQLHSKIDTTNIKIEDGENNEYLKNELLQKNNEIKDVFDKNRHFKTELKNTCTKLENLRQENTHLKEEKETLEKDSRNLSVALKSAKKDLKDAVKRFDLDKSSLEKELKKMADVKYKYESEARELKKKEKKTMKKERKEDKKAAELQVKRNEEERNLRKIKDNLNYPEQTTFHAALPADVCPHSPQCHLREPFPPPLGPKTQKEVELDDSIAKNESFIEKVLDFLKQEPGETIDDTIFKLESLKSILEPSHGNPEEESELDKLIESAKVTKEAIENLANTEDDYDEEYFQGLMDESLPRHYWGGEDGNDLIFEDYNDD